MNKTSLLPLLSLSLAACAGPPPCRPLDAESDAAPAPACTRLEPPAAPTPLTAPEDAGSPLERALRRYDAGALAALSLDADARTAALAAHGLGELLRLEASVAEGGGDDRRLEALVERRLEVARRGLERATAALARSPDDVDLLVARGELRAYLIDGLRAGLVHGRLARRDLEAALARAPGDPDARLAWAKQYYYLPAAAGGDLERAARDLAAVVADVPDHEPSWGFLGQVYLAQGREPEARAALGQALRLNPRSLRGRALLLREEDLE